MKRRALRWSPNRNKNQTRNDDYEGIGSNLKTYMDLRARSKVDIVPSGKVRRDDARDRALRLS